MYSLILCHPSFDFLKRVYVCINIFSASDIWRHFTVFPNMCHCLHPIIARISNQGYIQNKSQISGKPHSSNTQWYEIFSFWPQVLISEENLFSLGKILGEIKLLHFYQLKNGLLYFAIPSTSFVSSHQDKGGCSMCLFCFWASRLMAFSALIIF